MQEIEIVFKTYGDVTDVHVIAGDSGLAANNFARPFRGVIYRLSWTEFAYESN